MKKPSIRTRIQRMIYEPTPCQVNVFTGICISTMLIGITIIGESLIIAMKSNRK